MGGIGNRRSRADYDTGRGSGDTGRGSSDTGGTLQRPPDGAGGEAPEDSRMQGGMMAQRRALRCGARAQWRALRWGARAQWRVQQWLTESNSPFSAKKMSDTNTITCGPTYGHPDCVGAWGGCPGMWGGMCAVQGTGTRGIQLGSAGPARAGIPSTNQSTHSAIWADEPREQMSQAKLAHHTFLPLP